MFDRNLVIKIYKKANTLFRLQIFQFYNIIIMLYFEVNEY